MSECRESETHKVQLRQIRGYCKKQNFMPEKEILRVDIEKATNFDLLFLESAYLQARKITNYIQVYNNYICFAFKIFTIVLKQCAQIA